MSSSREISIQVQNLSKCYEVYSRPQDRLLQMLARGRKQYYQEFWALRDVSFEIPQGEAVGIIGRNGSGKSTLLQLICGTLNPSSGESNSQGKIAALLELGTGFNPEFTGRENVFLNASFYGITRSEIESRFDQIAAFADIGSYIEQPVKTYSSGMYVRLAFAVIAHVNADILIVDEALAVGDAVFTQKCMRFIRSFREHGTLLFVSHDMSSVLNLCDKAVWLDKGEVRQVGSAKEIAESYLQYTLQEVYGDGATLASVDQEEKKLQAPESQAEIQTDDLSLSRPDLIEPALDYESQVSINSNLSAANGWYSGGAEIIDVCLESLDDPDQDVFAGGARVRMVIQALAHQPLSSPILGFLVRDRLGQDLFGENTLPFSAVHTTPVEPEQKFKGEFVFRLPMLPNGQYAVMASVADGNLYSNVQHHWLHDALILNVFSSKVRWGLVGVAFEKVSLGCV